MTPQPNNKNSAPPEARLALFSPLRFAHGTLQLLDQTRLPREEVWLDCTTPEQVADAIRRLAVRGAPAIGVAAAYGLVLGIWTTTDADLDARFAAVKALLASTRPTAVNLSWALARGQAVFAAHRAQGAAAVRQALLAWADEVCQQDVNTNLAIGDHGRSLFQPGDRVLTHCNAGALATAGFGTALGVITAGWQRGCIAKVWVDETRPLLQGARLTAWELERLGIPFQLITDSSAGAIMARGEVDRIVVGADRIAANGDTANKIGTYTVAVLAHHHHVPFYIAAPLSTIDPHTPTGQEIPIEVRAPEEVTAVLGHPLAPAGSPALNLAFDVTPHQLIAGIITEVGVLAPPYTESIRRALG